MIKVGIIGGTGYTGVELLRLLSLHPEVEFKVITSRTKAGRTVADLFVNLRRRVYLSFVKPDNELLCACDVVFSATPNGIAMTYAPILLEAGVKLINIAADFASKISPRGSNGTVYHTLARNCWPKPCMVCRR